MEFDSFCKICNVRISYSGNICLCHEECIFKICDVCMIKKSKRVEKLKKIHTIGKFYLAYIVNQVSFL